ncbi:MAG: alpha/beta fold hydrolase [Thiohalocapsa sp.]
MPKVCLNDVELYYEVHGPDASQSRLPLMLVAGLASDSQSWLTVLAALAEHRSVVLLDNRGCGRTAPQHCPNSIDAMADDCIALADHLGIDRFDLLGHSMGGFVALDCALRYQERIGHLVLANAAAASSARNDALFDDWCGSWESGIDRALWFRNFFYWVFTPAFFEPASTVEDLLRLNLDYPFPQSIEGFAGQVAAIRGFDHWTALTKVGADTLVLCSERDLVFPPGADAAGLASIPGARVVVIPDQAHALHVEAPNLFLGPVLDFLR